MKMVESRASNLSEGEILCILREAGLGASPREVMYGNLESSPIHMEPTPLSLDALPRTRAIKVDLESRECNEYRLEELLAFHDTAFVSTAYRILLHRSPDAAGFSHYLGLLRDGISKTEILGRLRYSPEGKLRSANVQGLFAAMVKAMLYRIPVLGYAAETIITLFRLPAVIRNIRRFECFTVLSQDALRDDINALADVGNRNFNKINLR